MRGGAEREEVLRERRGWFVGGGGVGGSVRTRGCGGRGEVLGERK